MFERMVSIFVVVLSCFGLFYGSRHMDVVEDEYSYQATSNYVDVSFQNITCRGGRVIQESDSKVTIIPTTNEGEVTYQVYNNSSSFDVFISVSSSEKTLLKSGEVEYFKMPFDSNDAFLLELQVEPIQKEYLS